VLHTSEDYIRGTEGGAFESLDEDSHSQLDSVYSNFEDHFSDGRPPVVLFGFSSQSARQSTLMFGGVAAASAHRWMQKLSQSQSSSPCRTSPVFLLVVSLGHPTSRFQSGRRQKRKSTTLRASRRLHLGCSASLRVFDT
jgi:hypothetical protein